MPATGRCLRNCFASKCPATPQLLQILQRSTASDFAGLPSTRVRSPDRETNRDDDHLIVTAVTAGQRASS
jgi:hypothetical protein